MPITTIDREPIAPDVETDSPPETMLAVPENVRLRVDHDGFERLCVANRDLRLELEADGALIVMTPASTDGGGRELELGAQIRNWSKASGLGKAFGASSGYTLPDGSVKAPDASWIRRDRLETLPKAERDRFAHIVPDFVAEVRSPSDRLNAIRAKMTAYMALGVRLGWLIDPIAKTVEVYRPGRDVDTLTNPATLSGEDVLPGFTLDLADILHDAD